MIHQCFRVVVLLAFFALANFLVSDANALATSSVLAAESGVEQNKGINLAPVPGDLSIQFLGNLFGVVDGVLAGTGSQIAGQMFGVFNAAVLALAGIIASYTLLISTINSAQEGQFIGQRFSSVWVPVRTVGGAALILPKASGYCLMQIFIMWVVVQGVGAADRVWEQALSYLNKGGVLVQANVNAITNMKNTDDSVFNTAYGMLAGQVCMIALEQRMLAYQKEVKIGNIEGISCDSPPDPSSSSGAIESFCTTQMPDFMASVKFLSNTNLEVNGLVTLLMPNLDDYPYSELNGVCGAIQYNNFSVTEEQRTNMGLSYSEGESLKASRALALNQMFIFLSTLSHKLVGNAPFVTGEYCTNDDPQGCTSMARIPYGLPLTLDLKQCKAKSNPGSNACYSWELEEGAMSSILLRGTEIHDAVSTYNGMMSSTLFIQSQFNNTSNYKSLRKFIKESTQTGWILAGSYYFRLAILSSQVLQRSGGVRGDPNAGLAICMPGSTAEADCGAGLWSTTEFSGFFSALNGTTSMCVHSDNEIVTLFCAQAAPTSTNSSPLENNSITAMTDNISQLIQGEGSVANVPKIVNSALNQPTYNNTSYPQADSVYGLLINSTALVLPGQPGSSQPEITFITTYNATTNVPELGRSTIRGGMWNIPGQIMTGIYNYFLRYIVNLMMSVITPIVNMLIFAVLQRPLKLIVSIFFGAMTVLDNKNMNPIIGITNMGVGFVEGASNAWIAILLDFVIMAIQATFNPFMGFVQIALTFALLPIVTIWLSILMTVGVMSTFYMPFIPFLIFLFATIGWVIGVIEAMVAGPLIALGVMHPEGDRPFGKGDQAVTLLLGLFLRPSMMILGYVFGIILSYVGLWYINSGFMIVIPQVENTQEVNINTKNHVSYDPNNPYNQDLNGANYGENMNKMDNAFSDANDGINNGMKKMGQFFSDDTSIYGMWSRIFLIFFILLVYITSIISVVSKAFELIHMLPDRVMRWISDGQTDDLAGKVTSTLKSDLQEAQKDAGDKTSGAMAKINSTLMNAPMSAAASAKGMAEDIMAESKAMSGGSASATGSDSNKTASATGSNKKDDTKPQPKSTPAIDSKTKGNGSSKGVDKETGSNESDDQEGVTGTASDTASNESEDGEKKEEQGDQ